MTRLADLERATKERAEVRMQLSNLIGEFGAAAEAEGRIIERLANRGIITQPPNTHGMRENDLFASPEAPGNCQARDVYAGDGGPLIATPRDTAAPDPWKHRSAGMSCATCMWYVRKEGTPNLPGESHRSEVGRCRRHAPTMSGYPAVFPSDWCGDHKLDETKV